VTIRRAAVGICMLCAFALSVFAAQASAITGTTAFTCKNLEEPSGDFSDAHCKQASVGGKFKHIAIAQDTTTQLSVTNENESGEKVPARLKATIGGIALELVATSAQAEGSVENRLDASGEHYVSAHSVTTYSGITVAKPLGKGCKVYTDNGGAKGEEGVLHTNELATTTKEQGDAGKLAPAAGNTIATFIIDGCEGTEAIKNLNKTYEINGSVRCIPSGATVNCVHAEITAAGTLTLNGAIKAGVEVDTTFKGKDPAILGDTYRPLSATTVTT
jgi:hypothetical protein